MPTGQRLGSSRLRWVTGSKPQQLVECDPKRLANGWARQTLDGATRVTVQPKRVCLGVMPSATATGCGHDYSRFGSVDLSSRRAQRLGGKHPDHPTLGNPPFGPKLHAQGLRAVKADHAPAPGAR
ncbi:uncharacterized protein PV09_01201 [Verruconis gallopava]|uniref:Uncharacterized protein n=1 Tax=Verruconis gallopava TaxID=253628 RepID=A0A0D1Z5N1_9PEZI|nr:uncharacterized protein PV09_01201 [Verruconis gallopava]KIW08282.1 hypothetical protein PV09_01201 [Verruconis gallopava]